MSRIQFDFMIDLPRAIGSAWKVRDRPGGVALEVVEVRRGEAVGDAFEDVEVHFHQLLDFVEHAPDHRGRRVAGQLLDLPVGQQVDVELGADALDHPRQRHADFARRERSTCPACW